MSEKMSAAEYEPRGCPCPGACSAADYIATLQREADGMREALEEISANAENQDISHLNFRIGAKRCADQALEALSPQATPSEDTKP